MRAQRVRVALLLAVTLASCAVHCFQIQHGRLIPPRCQHASATPVSCEQVPPFNLLPHPDDCELFYYCVSPGAAPVCRQCPARLHFNPQLRVCDHPAAAGCAANSPPPPPRPTTPEPPHTEVDNDTGSTFTSTEASTTETYAV